MAIDSKAKRRSAVALKRVWAKGVEPDATQPQAWRQTAAWGWYGIAAGAAPVVVYTDEGSTLYDLEHRPLWEAHHRPVHSLTHQPEHETWLS